MKRILILSISIAFGIFSINSCKPKGNEPEPSKPTTPVDSGNVTLSVTSMFNSKVLNNIFPTTDTTWDKRKITITNAQMYLSHFEFTDLYGGGSYYIKTPFILTTLAPSRYDLGKAPEKSYLGMKLYVGLNANYNNQPNTYNSYLNDPRMWFDTVNNSMKYVFIRITGLVDTSANKRGAIDAPFDIKLGNGYHQLIDLPNNTPSAGSIGVTINYAEIIRGLDFTNPRVRNIITPANGAQFISIIKENLPNAIK